MTDYTAQERDLAMGKAALNDTDGAEKEEPLSSPSSPPQPPSRALWPLTTPCAVIERASCPDQRVIRTTLAHVAEAIEAEGSRPPGLLVVGAACEVLYTPERGRAWAVEEGFGGLLDVEDPVMGAAREGVLAAMG